MQCHSNYHRARLPLAIASAIGVVLMIVSVGPLDVGEFEDFTSENAKRDALSGIAQVSW